MGYWNLRLTSIIFLLILSIYSAILLAIEFKTSQDYVRQFFTDIEGDAMFFAVNTTASVSLLLGTSMLLMFAALAVGAKKQPEARPFLVSQSLMFGLLAFDDRFQLHERIAYRVDIADHYVMAVWALLEITAIIAFLQLRHASIQMTLLFLFGCGFFAIMMGFDALVPHNMLMRLSIEDLAKTWAAAMFFGFAWQTARFHLLGNQKPLSETLEKLSVRQHVPLS